MAIISHIQFKSILNKCTSKPISIRTINIEVPKFHLLSGQVMRQYLIL